MLHHGRQLGRERLRQRADGCAVFTFEPGENCPARRINERGKCPIKPLAIVHHVGKYLAQARLLSIPCACSGRECSAAIKVVPGPPNGTSRTTPVEPRRKP